MKITPFTCFAPVGKTFRVPCDGFVDGYKSGKRLFRFRRRPVKAGDTVVMVPGRGLSVNGTLVSVKARPWACREIKTGWVPRRLRLAVFFETGRLWSPGKRDHGKRTSAWLAADLRGYHMGQGETPAEAIRCLLLTLWMNEDDTDAEARREGKRHTRWHVERGAERELAEMEAMAEKNGFILEGVDWRASLAAMGGAERVERSFERRTRKRA